MYGRLPIFLSYLPAFLSKIGKNADLNPLSKKPVPQGFPGEKAWFQAAFGGYGAYRNDPKTGTPVTVAEKTRNQVVAQAARGFESHPVRQKSLYVFKREGFSLFCQHFVNKSYFKSGKIDV